MKKTNNIPQKIGVHVKCADFMKSYKFYRALGFKEVFAYGPRSFLEKLDTSIPTAPEQYRGVSFGIGDGVLEIAEAHIAVKPEVFKERIGSSKVSAFFDVGDLEALLACCRTNEIEIAVPPRDFPWGTREVVIKDPDGFVLVFRELVAAD